MIYNWGHRNRKNFKTFLFKEKINIPTYYGMLEYKGHYFLIMEKINGITLADLYNDKEIQYKIIRNIEKKLEKIPKIKEVKDRHAYNVMINNKNKLYLIDLEGIKINDFA